MTGSLGLFLRKCLPNTQVKKKKKQKNQPHTLSVVISSSKWSLKKNVSCSAGDSHNGIVPFLVAMIGFGCAAGVRVCFSFSHRIKKTCTCSRDRIKLISFTFSPSKMAFFFFLTVIKKIRLWVQLAAIALIYAERLRFRHDISASGKGEMLPQSSYKNSVGSVDPLEGLAGPWGSVDHWLTSSALTLSVWVHNRGGFGGGYGEIKDGKWQFQLFLFFFFQNWGAHGRLFLLDWIKNFPESKYHEPTCSIL